MVLLNNVVEVFALPNLDASIFINIVLFYASDIGAAFVDIDQTGLAIGADRFVQKS